MALFIDPAWFSIESSIDKDIEPEPWDVDLPSSLVCYNIMRMNQLAVLDVGQYVGEWLVLLRLFGIPLTCEPGFGPMNLCFPHTYLLFYWPYKHI